MNSVLSYLCLVTVGLSTVAGTAAQSSVTNNQCKTSDSKGTEFVVGFMETMSPSADPRLYIVGASTRSTRVTVHSPRNGKVNTTISQESRIKVIQEDGPSETAILVTADHEITVYGVEEGNSMDSFLVLPTDALGTEYYVVSYSISHRLERQQRKSQFSLLGVLNDTVVDITLTGGLMYEGRTYTKGDRITVTLNRLQVIHFASEDEDLTGTRVVGNKKLGVLSGSKCADVPVGMRFCDHLVEMLPPVQSWGARFITSPLYGRSGGDAFRIMAARDHTTVTVPSFGAATLHAGMYFEIEIPSNSSRSIYADRPILVTQYSMGGDADQSQGDPFMMIVPAIEQFSNNAVFFTIQSLDVHQQLTNYANVIIECRYIVGLEHNLFEVPRSSFTRLDSLRHTVDGKDYCTAQMNLARGVHFLRNAWPDAYFSLTLYGMGVAEGAIAYGMPAGLRLPSNTCEVTTGSTATDNFATVATETAATERKPLQDSTAVIIDHGGNRPAVPKPLPPPSLGPSVNRNQSNNFSSGKYLILFVLVIVLLLITICILVIYTLILRRRIRKLESECKVYSRVQLSPVMVGADGYIGLDGSQHGEREYMTLNNPQGVWRLGKVRRLARSTSGVPYVANTAINTNSNGISQISEPIMVSNNIRNSIAQGERVPAGARRKTSAPETSSRTISVDSNHVIRFSNVWQNTNNQDVPSTRLYRGTGNPLTDSNLQIVTNEGQHPHQNGNIPTASDSAANESSVPAGPRTSATRTTSLHEQPLQDIAEFPEKIPPPRTIHLQRSVSQPPYQTSLRNAPKVYYSVPKNNRPINVYDRPRKRSSSTVEEPIVYSIKEALLKHDDGYMSMRDHRASVSSQESSSPSLSSSPVVFSPPDIPPPYKGTDSAETDSTDYTELF